MKSASFLIILIFFLSRIICYALGIKLHAPLEGPQTIDLNLLKNRALESIFYLHSQPPLFNLCSAQAIQNHNKI